ncbi:hypothetical protein DM860_007875 [Cuscuta australis]|uniref:Uncharacterized protein n=1 Tax=Cuscuta australis TaxID=267555 RepID=A0A328E177_9ASTE|nr:hypothetical protein DM860_007875 [Cuscuta australis]
MAKSGSIRLCCVLLILNVVGAILGLSAGAQLQKHEMNGPGCRSTVAGSLLVLALIALAIEAILWTLSVCQCFFIPDTSEGIIKAPKAVKIIYGLLLLVAILAIFLLVVGACQNSGNSKSCAHPHLYRLIYAGGILCFAPALCVSVDLILLKCH